MSGVVLVSDGADTSDTSLADALLGMKAEKLPVFTVGVGSPQLPRDIQIDRVSTPRSVLKDASLIVDVVVTQTGYAGRTVTVDVEDEGRIVGSRTGAAAGGRQPRHGARARRPRPKRGPRLFKFRVAPQPDEVVTQNNVRESLIQVRDTRETDPLFRRRAAVRDEVHPPRGCRRQEPVRSSSLQRTADNKFMRLGVDGAGRAASAASRRRARSCSRTAG